MHGLLAHRGWGQDFALAIGAHFGNNTRRFHRLNQAGCAVVSYPHLALYRRNGCTAALGYIINGLIVERIALLALASGGAGLQLARRLRR